MYNSFPTNILQAKKAATAPAPTPAPAATPVAPAAPAPAATPSQAPPTTAAPAPAPSSQEETSTTTATTSTPAPTSDSDDFPAEVISNLTGMGFPEAEVRACLRASQGNPDVAVEFLMNGIPPAVQAVQQSATPSTPATGNAPAPTSGRTEPLQALRDHPQINQLRALVQSNPQTLQAVLTQIGQQEPELLREINSNQAAFLQIMNEPVEENNAPVTPAPSSTSTTTPPPAPGPTTGGSSGSGSGSGSGFGLGMLEGMSNPAQMAEMLQSMNPTELQGMASMMGLTPEQLTATAQMISQMPPEQFQEYMNMAMQGGGMAGLMGGMGGGAEGGAGNGGPQVLRLSEEEMAAVDRLADMGFDRAEAAQAYLACDKNEALAANLLMDGGFGFDETGMGGGATGGGGGGNDDDDMYD